MPPWHPKPRHADPAPVSQSAPAKVRNHGREFACHLVLPATQTPGSDLAIEGFARLVMENHRPHAIIFELHNRYGKLQFLRKDCKIAISVNKYAEARLCRAQPQIERSSLNFELTTVQPPQITPGTSPQPMNLTEFGPFYYLSKINWDHRKVIIRATCKDILSHCSENVQRWLRKNVPGFRDYHERRRPNSERSLSPHKRHQLPERARSPLMNRPWAGSKRTGKKNALPDRLHCLAAYDLDQDLLKDMSSLNIRVPEEDKEWETTSEADEADKMAWSCERDFSGL
ncbi:hypothetical protein MYU51_000275 [Penicillium brevicompactum]|uniref:uncharacterized protein n=1 Tax=Penicillium brevicompactum TaxID=5074 RepID=UPI002540E8B2|nr:uncharacterized protein N7506_008639 [Penicillium brevicompactum]KAJ5325537.1 hypothetical protein N7506_008639 [Penicillium brevicompactum]